MTDEAHNALDVVLAAFQLVIVMVAACWAFFRFRRERTHSPRIEFVIDTQYFDAVGDAYACEVAIFARNKGLVKHTFRSILLNVRAVKADKPLADWRDNEPRLEFPCSIVRDQEVIYKRKYDTIFVEPGVEQRINYVFRVPKEYGLIVVRAEFHYSGESTKPHSAERVFAVPNLG